MGHRPRAFQHWKKKVSTVVSFGKEIVKALAPVGWLVSYHRWRDKGKPWGFEELPVNWSPEGKAWMKGQAEDFFRRFSLHRAPVEDQIWDRRTVQFNESWDTGPSWYETEYTYPLADRRIIEFLLSIPVEYFELDGRKRGLLRRAMEGLLPPLILDRTDKKDYSPGYQQVMYRDLDKILTKVRFWQQTALLSPWVVYSGVLPVLEDWKANEKSITFDYKFFFIKNLFVFLWFLEKHFSKVR